MEAEMIFAENEKDGLSSDNIRSLLEKLLHGRKINKALLIPPDHTRSNSGAGLITAVCYEMLDSAGVHTDVLPALGTHTPMTRREQTAFFGENIPGSRFLVHDWRSGVRKIGEVPRSFVNDVSGGLIDEAVSVEVSNYLLDKTYDFILSIGQVVPHEVAGLANYTKNIVVGCGGSSFINSSHMLGAAYGMERIMGLDNTPVRRVFDYAQEHFISQLGVEYALTVTVTEHGGAKILGLYTGSTREVYNRAASMSRKHNITRVGKPFETCLVSLDGTEYRSTWLGNKAIYRTRMAMADGGNLIILAPGVCRFGEDASIDNLLRKYGYIGTEAIVNLCKTQEDLQENLSAAAHLIHGSSDGRFTVTYAAGLLSRDEIESAGFSYIPYDEAVRLYNPDNLKQGYNRMNDGTEIYYIDNPALGLWMYED